MARIRDCLQKTTFPPGASLLQPSFPRPFKDNENARPAEVVKEEVPYIEVGAPNRAVEASPSVLAVAAKPVGPAAGLQAGPKQDALAADGAYDIGPVSIKFQPVPAEEPPLAPPGERFHRQLVALHDPTHPVNAQYYEVLEKIKQQLCDGQPQVLLFTATTASTDATTVLLNLAIWHALHGQGDVTVVDANLRRPRVADLLGLARRAGLSDILAGAVSLQHCVRETGVERLQVLTAGTSSGSSLGVLAGQSMRAVLRHLREKFQWVFVDGPVWDGRPELVGLGSACDAIYLVADDTDLQRSAVEELIQVIPQQGGCLRGCIYAGRNDF